MIQKLTKFKFFTISQYKEEQEYLSEMHASGWKLISINFPGFYHFEKCVPEEVVYQLDYNPNGYTSRREYIQMFSDLGWEYMFNYVGYNYFRKPVNQMEGNEEIFCDDESRLDMMKRVFKGRITPLLIIFFGILIPQLLLNASGLASNPIRRAITVIYLMLLITYSAFFVIFGFQYISYERKIKGETTSNHIKKACLIIITIILYIIIGCAVTKLSSYRNSRYLIKNDTDQYSIGAEYLDKTIKHEMILNEGDELEVSLVVMEGKLSVSIGMEGEESLYEGTVSDFTTCTLYVHKTGKYSIVTTGEDAEGSFSFIIK